MHQGSSFNIKNADSSLFAISNLSDASGQGYCNDNSLFSKWMCQDHSLCVGKTSLCFLFRENN